MAGAGRSATVDQRPLKRGGVSKFSLFTGYQVRGSHVCGRLPVEVNGWGLKPPRLEASSRRPGRGKEITPGFGVLLPCAECW